MRPVVLDRGRGGVGMEKGHPGGMLARIERHVGPSSISISPPSSLSSPSVPNGLADGSASTG